MKRIYLTILLTLGLSSLAFAGGFQQWQQTGRSVGNDAAGAAAIANDASTAFYNPAGMVRIHHQDAAFSAIAKLTSVKYKGSANVSSAITGFSPTSGNAQGGTASVIPTIFYVAPINDKWAFGFVAATPYHMYLKYDRHEFTRYAVVKNQIYTIDIGPTLAWRPFKPISIGAGFDAEYLYLRYNQVDTTTSTANDQLSETTLKNWGFGWNAGVLWMINQHNRIGLSYRSRIHFSASGDSRYAGTTTHARTSVSFPPIIILSAYRDFTEKLALMATVNYTLWHVLDNFRLTNVNGQGGVYTILLQRTMKNSFGAAIGADYKATKALTVRGGLGFDQSPISTKYLNLAMPSTNQFLVAIGLSYEMTKTLSFDAGFLHGFATGKSFNNTQSYGAESVVMNGRYENGESLFGLQINWLMT